MGRVQVYRATHAKILASWRDATSLPPWRGFAPARHARRRRARKSAAPWTPPPAPLALIARRTRDAREDARPPGLGLGWGLGLGLEWCWATSNDQLSCSHATWLGLWVGFGLGLKFGFGSGSGSRLRLWLGVCLGRGLGLVLGPGSVLGLAACHPPAAGRVRVRVWAIVRASRTLPAAGRVTLTLTLTLTLTQAHPQLCAIVRARWRPPLLQRRLHLRNQAPAYAAALSLLVRYRWG
eukprot:scaffold56903_cov61-Phaeocystis_antarctica.AAC.5